MHKYLHMMLLAFLTHQVLTKYNFEQVEHIAYFHGADSYFGSDCSYDWLEIAGTMYCGAFNQAFTPGTNAYKTAPELPYTLAIDVNGLNNTEFHFITDSEYHYKGFLLCWRLEDTI